MMTAMQPNPYAPPQSETLTAPLDDGAEAEALRREHIGTEATIRSVGLLYYLSGFICVLVGVSSLAPAESGTRDASVALVPIFSVLGVAQFVVGYGLRRLRGWTRVPTLILSGLGLLAFPIGTAIHGYIIANVLSKKGQFVMQPEYQRIISATPHVKHKTSAVVWILLVLVLIAVLAAVIFLGMQAR